MIIDVSHNNGVINWEAVKPHIESVILRVGYGDDISSQDDRQFQQNLAECHRLGIPISGYYIYSYAKSDAQARSEASHALRLAPSDAIIYFDSEQKGTEGVARRCAEIFRDAIHGAGRKVGLYAGNSWYHSFLEGIEGFDALWIARYGRNNGQQDTKPTVDCNLWQYTSKASVPGINDDVDANTILKPIEPPQPEPEPFVPPEEVANAVYRLYNPNQGDHFYTHSANERNNLIQLGWKYEGVAWKSPDSGDSVFRLYNPNAGDHFYTTSVSEKKNLVSVGWICEGVAFLSDQEHRVEIYRLYNPNQGDHFYTTSSSERDNLVSLGWSYEGVGFYGAER